MSLFLSGHIKILYAGLVGNVVRFIYISLLKSPWMVLPFELVQGNAMPLVEDKLDQYSNKTPDLYTKILLLTILPCVK